MAMNTLDQLEKIFEPNQQNEIIVDSDIALMANKSLQRMLDFKKTLS